MKEMKVTAAVILFAVLVVPVFGQWSESYPLEEINVESLREWTPCPSYDGLSLYFAQGRGASGRHLRLYEATRAEPFGPFTSITEALRAGDDVYHPWVSPDNLRMYYIVEEGSSYVLRLSQRASIVDSWPTGSRVSEINSVGRIYSASFTTDELIIVFAGPGIPGGMGGQDIWMASRADRTQPFGNVINLGQLNTTAGEGSPSISSDGLTVFFSSDRNGIGQVFQSSRTSVEEPFGVPEPITIFDMEGSDCGQPGISSDGKALYFIRGYSRERRDIWVSYLAGLDVLVDIKPGTCPNPLNLSSRGVLAVGILGTDDFDVSSD